MEILARGVTEWREGMSYLSRGDGVISWSIAHPGCECHTKLSWEMDRERLGLIMTEEEEAMGIDSAWEHCKQQQPTQEVPHNKYQREIKPDVYVDVYDVLQAWGVSNPALQHLIKKALQPGERGHKSKAEDMADIVASALRAEKLEGGK